MSTRTPKVGDVLRCEDGSALVVEPGTTPLDGLLTLVEYEYGGDRFAPDNPVIVAALASTRVVTWFSCSKAWREEHCDGYSDDWWSGDGDGKRSITVAWYDGDTYLLGDDASDTEGGAENG